jgi:hypothetical protein
LTAISAPSIGGSLAYRPRPRERYRDFFPHNNYPQCYLRGAGLGETCRIVRGHRRRSGAERGPAMGTALGEVDPHGTSRFLGADQRLDRRSGTGELDSRTPVYSRNEVSTVRCS